MSLHANDTPEFLKRSISPRALARRNLVSPTTVYKWIDEGMPSALIGARRLIHIPTADLWLKEKLGIKETPEERANVEPINKALSASDPFNPTALLLDQSFADTAGFKKILTTPCASVSTRSPSASCRKLVR